MECTEAQVCEREERFLKNDTSVQVAADAFCHHLVRINDSNSVHTLKHGLVISSFNSNLH